MQRRPFCLALGASLLFAFEAAAEAKRPKALADGPEKPDTVVEVTVADSQHKR